MKRTLRTILVCALLLCLCVSLFAGCGKKKKDGRITVVATIFPVYDWARNLLGRRADEINLVLLENTGADLHNYQPTIEDIAVVSTCDVFLYIGGESDGWVDDALRQATNKDMVVVNLLDALGDAARDEALLEGMEEDEEEEEEAKDEHIWLSPKNAALLVSPISEALKSADPDHKDAYVAAAADYLAKLNALDRDYADAVNAASGKTLLFADRFPFLYLVEDYGLTAYAAFSGCSAETEASFSMITFLAGKVAELELKHVLVLEGSDGRLASTVISESGCTGIDVLKLNSLQSVTGADADSGTSYLDVMRDNLAVLKQALAD